MKKSLGILLLLVLSGLVLGVGGTYLVHLATSTDDNDGSTVPRAALGSQNVERGSNMSYDADLARELISTSDIQSVLRSTIHP